MAEPRTLDAFDHLMSGDVIACLERERTEADEFRKQAEKRNREARIMLSMLCDVISRIPLGDDASRLIRARDVAVAYMEIDW